MKIARRIERRIEVDAREVYDLLAARHDLPMRRDDATFTADFADDSTGTLRGTVTLIVVDRTEEEL